MVRRVGLIGCVLLAVGGLLSAVSVGAVWVRGDWRNHEPVEPTGLEVVGSEEAEVGGLYADRFDGRGFGFFGQTREGYTGELPVPGPWTALLGATSTITAALMVARRALRGSTGQRRLAIIALWTSLAALALASWTSRAWETSCCAEVGPGVAIWQVGGVVAALGSVTVLSTLGLRRDPDATGRGDLLPLVPWLALACIAVPARVVLLMTAAAAVAGLATGAATGLVLGAAWAIGGCRAAERPSPIARKGPLNC